MADYKKVSVKTWYLKFSKSIPEMPKNMEVKRWVNPPVQEYLSVYNEVGAAWGWTGRQMMSTDKLKQVLSSANNEIWRCFVGENLIGFFELDRTVKSKSEIVYIGLFPEFIGKGYGKDFFNCAINIASNQNRDEVWLHTCKFDHENALSMYLKAGFEVFEETMESGYYSVDFLNRVK